MSILYYKIRYVDYVYADPDDYGQQREFQFEKADSGKTSLLQVTLSPSEWAELDETFRRARADIVAARHNTTNNDITIGPISISPPNVHFRNKKKCIKYIAPITGCSRDIFSSS